MFVIVNPVSLFPVIDVIYLSTALSLILYSINFPALYFGKSLNAPFHPFADVIAIVFTFEVPAYKSTMILSPLASI